jgi:DNA-directed RNA polymerase II subunit RPB1
MISTKLTYEQRRRLAELARRREADLPFVDIEEVYLTLFSSEEIKAMAVTEVTNTEDTGPGSINDPQMGPTDNNSLCATCSRDIVECPGHPGYIRLPKPMVHPNLTRKIINVLNIVCNDCGGLLLTRDEIRERGLHHLTLDNRLKSLEKASIGLSCRRRRDEGDRPCVQNPTYMTNKTRDTNQIMYEYTLEGENLENVRKASEILDIFNNITQEEAELMGFTNGSHPRNMIMEFLLVIPPNARQPNEVDGKYMADPLTTMYKDIVRRANTLKYLMEGKKPDEGKRRPRMRKSGKPITEEEAEKELFERIKYFINNTDGWSSGGGQPQLSLTELLQGKEGLIRNNMMAKRVNFSSRTVLSPDPTLAFGQLAVPLAMAPILTPRVVVNRYNRAELQNLLEKGRITYIIFNEKPVDPNSPEAQLAGTRNQVTEKYRRNYTLRDGDKVERWLRDGDIIIFNRQPTLHKYSFMGYRVVIRDQKTFGLNLSYTTPINADFDGDEGNVHILQALDSAAEAQELLSVRNCLINQQSNKPTMGIVFNGPIASMLMTQPETTIRPTDYFDALTYLTSRSQLATLESRMKKYNIPYTTPVEVGKRYFVIRDEERIDLETGPQGNWGIRLEGGDFEYPEREEIQSEPILETHFTGRALFSALLPEDLYYEGPKGVTIQEGVLTNGVITKAHIGPERNSIIHVMAMNYPVGRIVDFLTDTTYVLNRWLQDYGFSIGLSSCLIENPEFQKDIEEQIEKARMLVSAMGAQPEDPLEAQKWEEQVLAYIGAPADVIGRKIQTTLSKDNALNIAALSGAKGKVSNVIQIAAFLGQQHLQGTRPKEQMTFETRCLPWFRSGDESLEAHGFCTASFLKGLPPSQMYFHQMAAREGLMGTATQTAETGFMHRKAVKTLQDVKTAYDGSVRNFDQTIFEYVYGDDGFAPNKLQIVETRTGKFLSFIDVKNVAAQINTRYGF